jgi:hypothetical protein
MGMGNDQYLFFVIRDENVSFTNIKKILIIYHLQFETIDGLAVC